MRDPLLRVVGLRKTFSTAHNEVRALENVSFEIEKGETYTLLGPSGCGKTTTLRCVAGLERPDEGEIWIGKELVFGTNPPVCVPTYKRDIGMVFQSYAIWPHMTVFKNVSYPLDVGPARHSKDDIARRVMQVLRLVQIETLAGRSATELSGGQQQRVALARALVAEPSLLLLDEPLSNLDAKLREEMRQELKEVLRTLGITALYVTHDHAEALALSNRVAVMHGGRIVQEGKPRELYTAPGNRFVAEFLGGMNRFEGRVNNSGRVELAIGALACPFPGAVRAGDRVVAVLRPEAITFGPAPRESEDNWFRGIIEAETFLGDSIEYQVRINGQFIRVRVPTYQTPVYRGDVFVHFPPDAVTLFPL